MTHHPVIRKHTYPNVAAVVSPVTQTEPRIIVGRAYLRASIRPIRLPAYARGRCAVSAGNSGLRIKCPCFCSLITPQQYCSAGPRGHVLGVLSTLLSCFVAAKNVHIVCATLAGMRVYMYHLPKSFFADV